MNILNWTFTRVVILLGAGSACVFAGACSGIDVGSSLYGHLSWHGFVPGSATSTFRQDITNAPVDSRSATWLTTLSRTNHGSVYPANSVYMTDVNFGGAAWEGYQVHYVHGNTQRRMVIRDSPAPRESYPGDSDPGTVPVPNRPRIQTWYGPLSRPWGVFLDRYLDPHAGGTASDQHIFVVDVDNCLSYELYGCFDDGSSISCAAYSAYYLPGGDLQRPYNLTGGASVSGQPMMFGLLRKDEFDSGTIPHALAVSMLPSSTDVAFTGAASHAQCCGAWSPTLPPFGAKLRLKAGFDTGGFPASCAPIFAEMKKYGLVAFDGGATADIFTETDYKWPLDCPIAMRTSALVNPTNFDIIDTQHVYCLNGTTGCPDQQPTGAAPVISSFTASPSTIPAGQSAVLRWAVSGVVDVDSNPIPMRNISYSSLHPGTACTWSPDVRNPCKAGPGWLDGPAHGESTVVRPTVTTVYKLMVQNRFGRTWSDVTVNVQ